jgi:hypothetical protein
MAGSFNPPAPRCIARFFSRQSPMIGHAMTRVSVTLGLLMLFGAAIQAQTGVRAPPEVNALGAGHPAEYYKQAANLFRSGRKDDAVFVFYLGQLRYRAHLSARRNLPADGDPALLGSLSETVGRPLNEYAFGDLSTLAAIIDAVLAHDAASPDRFTPPAQFPGVHAGVRDGLSRMKETMLKDTDRIRESRRRNGLENRR